MWSPIHPSILRKEKIHRGLQISPRILKELLVPVRIRPTHGFQGHQLLTVDYGGIPGTLGGGSAVVPGLRHLGPRVGARDPWVCEPTGSCFEVATDGVTEMA